jgi:REP element-mobilizing transposase RayT
VRDRRASDPTTPSRIEHDRPGEPWEPSQPALRQSAQALMKGPPIYLTLSQADTALAQFLETADHRGWTMLAASIMANHYHLVIQAADEWTADRILADLKAYATRSLNREHGKPPSKTWWTGKGSKRRLKDDGAIADGVNCVLDKQPNPLVVWSREHGRLV